MGFARGKICLMWAASSQKKPSLGGLGEQQSPFGGGCRGDVPQPCVQRGLGVPEEPGGAASCWASDVDARALLAPQVVGEVSRAELPAENQSLHRQVSPVLSPWKRCVEVLGSDVFLHLGPAWPQVEGEGAGWPWVPEIRSQVVGTAWGGRGTRCRAAVPHPTSAGRLWP